MSLHDLCKHERLGEPPPNETILTEATTHGDRDLAEEAARKLENLKSKAGGMGANPDVVITNVERNSTGDVGKGSATVLWRADEWHA